MFVIKNVTAVPLIVDGVSIDPGEQLAVQTLSAEMNAAWDAKKLQVKDGNETLAERKADVDAIKPFKTGDPAIDG